MPQVTDLLLVAQFGELRDPGVVLRALLLEVFDAGEEFGRPCLPVVGVDVVDEVHDPGLARTRQGAARDDLCGDRLDVARLGGLSKRQEPGAVGCIRRGHRMAVLRRSDHGRPAARGTARPRAPPEYCRNCLREAPDESMSLLPCVSLWRAVCYQPAKIGEPIDEEPTP